MRAIIRLMQRLQPLETPARTLFALVLRVWLFRVFFVSGLTKIQSWSTTLTLFEYEYDVPLLSPAMAAYLATGAELILPSLLLVGLLGRFSALALFVFNLVAVTSYPDISPAGVQQHIMWGVMLAYFVVSGPGKLSLDHWLLRRYGER
ncbi:DoxX family protein [Marinobacterium arenosum]|uniref:DoxX family protein n=1 Tax=Marinobacterium arenosum TaxID=2862496 RepID=UPI001C95FC12|nr:DoxX family protein [Marinobacterium arenosum]MBY4678076.1 DoxX family protein [Marinobacterium arenosum]